MQHISLQDVTVSQCVGLNVPIDTQQLISEMSLSRQSIALVLFWQPK